jgi:hypothetical protein
MKTEQKFTVWNPYKLTNTRGDFPLNVMHLFFEEMRSGGRVSSDITTDADTLAAMLSATYNETDVQLMSVNKCMATEVTFYPHVKPHKQGTVIGNLEHIVIVFKNHNSALDACKVWEDGYGLTTSVRQIDLIV